MIIQCKKCRTKFNINETFFKNEGSKVKCSRCKHVFVAFPLKRIDVEEQQVVIVSEEGLEAPEEATGAGRKEEMDFDENFEEKSMEDIEELEAEYHEDLRGVEEKAGMEEASFEDIEKKAEDEPKDGTETIKAVSEKEKSGKFNTLLIFFVIIFILLGIAYAVTKWIPVVPDFLTMQTTKPSEEQKSADQGASRLEILTVNGSFVDSEKAGRFFVIRGKVRNGYPKSRSFILVKGSILDDKGQVVKEKTAYAGNEFEEKDLLKLPFEEINRAMENRPGLDNKNLNVKPGTTVDFAIVFEDLPENLSEFTVGAVSSSPGSG